LIFSLLTTFQKPVKSYFGWLFKLILARDKLPKTVSSESYKKGIPFLIPKHRKRDLQSDLRKSFSKSCQDFLEGVQEFKK